MYGYLNAKLCAGSIDALYSAIEQLGADADAKAEVEYIGGNRNRGNGARRLKKLARPVVYRFSFAC